MPAGRVRTAAFCAWLALLLAGCAAPRDVVPWREPPRGAARGIEAGPGRHLVMPGETVRSIARRYGLDWREIVRLNRLEPPYTIYVGQVLRLVPEVPPGGRIHRVRRGETLSHIALRYRTSVRALLAANPGIEPRRLRVGQAVVVPSAGRSQAGVRTLPPPPRPRRVATAGPTPEERAARERARRAALATPPPLSGRGFAWPVRGRVIARFGRRADGWENDGVNIAAPEGTPVRAAENGIVVYAGEDIPAFGRMVILRHAGGWLTAYAHNAELLVRVGDVVRRGQTIAKVGSSGAVDRPQLHFQLRRGREPVDPLAHLPRTTRVAARGGSALQ